MSIAHCAVRIVTGPSLEPREYMKYEANRLASFQHGSRFENAVPSKLARHGLYYPGSGANVLCISCDHSTPITEIQSKFGEEIRAAHHTISPNCNFIESSDNIPLVCAGEPVPVFCQDAVNYMNHPVIQYESNLYCSNNDTDAITLKTSLNESDSAGSPIPRSASVKQQPAGVPKNSAAADLVESDMQSQNKMVKNPGEEYLCSSLTKTYPERNHNTSDLKYEVNRLMTYQGRWPASCPVKPEQLAKAGFYYLDTEDRVRCHFCKGMLRGWEQMDNPLEEHRKHFPTCGFHLGHDVGNIPAEGLVVAASQPSGQESQDGPKHPRMAEVSDRIRSFKLWPHKNSHEPGNMADAGFFYAGYADNVKCFYCDGGLRNWEPQDDPTEEHAKWFPRCAHIRSYKGEEYVNRIQRANPQPPLVQANLANHSSNASSVSSASNIGNQPSSSAGLLPSSEEGNVQYRIQPREVRARMDTPIVQAVLSMGVKRELVQKAIENRLVTTGDDFSGAEALLEAVFHIEDTSVKAQQGAPSIAEKTHSEHTSAQQQKSLATRSSMEAASSPVTKKAKKSRKRGKRGSGSTLASEIGEMDIKGPEPQDICKLDEETKSLRDENTRLKEQKQCKICMDSDANIVFLPCGHLVACGDCAAAIRNCAICRALIRGTVRTYLV